MDTQCGDGICIPRQSVGFVTLSLVIGSCDSSVAPSPSPPQPDTLTIAPAIDALKTGLRKLTPAIGSLKGVQDRKDRRQPAAAWACGAAVRWEPMAGG
jgi:hypothetical protein